MTATESNSNNPRESASALSPIDCSGSITDFRAHCKNFNEAVNYIWNYVNNPDFSDFSYDAGACAEICREHLPDFTADGTTSGHKHCGLILYFCYLDREFFFGYRIKSNLDDGVPQFPSQDDVTYYLSNCNFVFDPADIVNSSTLARTIANYRNICDCTDDPATATKEKIRDYGTAFLNKFNDPAIINYPIGFFHFQQLKDLLTQNDRAGDSRLACTGIRFFWGFDDSANEGQKIKLVAFGIDGFGNNIIAKYDGSAAVIIERSWPPD